MRAFNILAFFQGIYFTLTGIWPILHIKSFIAVTGPKTDIWLVKTVGMEVLAIGITLLYVSVRETFSKEIFVLAVTSAIGFLIIDVFYVITGTISEIYLIDSILQITFITGWLFWFRKERMSGKTL